MGKWINCKDRQDLMGGAKGSCGGMWFASSSSSGKSCMHHKILPTRGTYLGAQHTAVYDEHHWPIGLKVAPSEFCRALTVSTQLGKAAATVHLSKDIDAASFSPFPSLLPFRSSYLYVHFQKPPTDCYECLLTYFL